MLSVFGIDGDDLKLVLTDPAFGELTPIELRIKFCVFIGGRLIDIGLRQMVQEGSHCSGIRKVSTELNF